MNLIDRYTARNVLAAMLVVQVLLMGLDLVINYISGLDDVENHYGAFEVLLYTLMRLPWRFYQYAPGGRSEESRVGKECRSGGSPYH